MTRLVFEEPPTRIEPSKKTKHQRIAATLTKHPGQWALIGTYPTQGTMSSVAHQIRTGKTKAYGPQGSFDAVGRAVAGKHKVWARYVGEHGEHA